MQESTTVPESNGRSATPPTAASPAVEHPRLSAMPVGHQMAYPMAVSAW